MAPETMAAFAHSPLSSSFFLITLLSFSIFLHPTSSVITYDRQTLLDIRLNMEEGNTPPPNNVNFRCEQGCLPVCLPWIRKRRRRKRGNRAGILVKVRRRQHRPTLPTILLANVQSLENKLDEFRARLQFQRESRDCHVFAFTETWLEPTLEDSAILPDGLSVFRQDRTSESGKTKGGGVCLFVNKRWCNDTQVISAGCSPHLEHVMIRCRPYYLPREFA